MPRASRFRLPVLVFVAGAASLAAEMTGTRLLAPFFGASNLVWANVIGLILIYLSVGYWLGGRLADRHPTERALGLLVLGAAVALAVVPFATRPLFSAAQGAFEGLSAGAFIGSFLGAMLMFALPVTALGAVSPWAVRLSVRDVADGRRGLRSHLCPLHGRAPSSAPSCRFCCSSRRSAPGGPCS